MNCPTCGKAQLTERPHIHDRAATPASPETRMGVEYPIARRLRVREAGAARGGSTRRSPYR